MRNEAVEDRRQASPQTPIDTSNGLYNTVRSQEINVPPKFTIEAVRAWAKQTRIKEATAIRLIEMKGGFVVIDQVNT